MTTEQRLDRLERGNRWMRRIGAVAVFFPLAALAAVIGQGKDKVPPDLVVRSLKLEDKDGRVRLEAATAEDSSPYLILLDKRSTTRLKLDMHADDGGSYLSLWDEDGRLRTMVDGLPFLVFRDKDGKTRAWLTLAATDGSPLLRLYDAKGTVIWEAPR